MKKKLLFGVITLLAGSLLAADSSPKDDVVNAAKTLGSQTNYTWRETVESPDGGRFSGPTDGKTEKGGYTWLSMTRGDNTIEALIKGNTGAVKTQDNGWQSLSDASDNDNGGGFNRMRFLARMLQNYKTPDVQAADLANHAQNLKEDDDMISGDLNEDGVKALFPFRRGNGPDISDAKGSAKFWVKDGQLTKYQYHISATISFNGNDHDIDRTTTVDIKDVNATKIVIPDDAKKSLQ
jgi:hypothetical protein